MTAHNPQERPDVATVDKTIVRIVKSYNKTFDKVMKIGGLGLLGVLAYKATTS